MKRRIFAVLLLACLLVSLMPVGSAAGIYFVAVNDTIPLTLSTDVAPFYEDGIYLIPHTAFSVSGLGVTPSYNAEKRVLTLFSRSKRLVFDVTAGTVTDEKGTEKQTTCVQKNGAVFLPAAFCAAHFGLGISVQTSMGKYQVVRFTNGTQVYNDKLFIEKAENLIAYRVQQYQNEQAKPVNPPKQEEPKPPVVPETEKNPATAYLAVTDASAMPGALRALSGRRIPAVFFFAEAELLEQPALVISVCAAGYPVGLTVAAEEKNVAQSLSRANELLDQLTHSKTLLVLLTTEQATSAKDYFAIHRDRAVSAVRAAEREGRSSLVVCGNNYNAVLTTLTNAQVQFRQLRETSHF